MTNRGSALSLLTLNVSRAPRRRVPGLLAYLSSRPEQVLILTEVAPGDGATLLAGAFLNAGHAVAGPSGTARDLGVMVVGRSLAMAADDEPGPPGSTARVRCVVVESPRGPVRVAGVYGAASDPVRYGNAAQRQRKRAWIASFDDWLGAWLAASELPAVVIGDLNYADPVHTDPLPYVLAEETAAYIDLTAAHALTDAWREANPLAAEASWVDHSGAGCRYDHAFVTADLLERVEACALDQTPRLEGLTDHAALSLTLR